MIPAWMVGEFAGTFILVFFGCGSVCAAVTTGADVIYILHDKPRQILKWGRPSKLNCRFYKRDCPIFF
jgi:glycerol uptake facilitator-like aquaporin